VSRLVVYEEWPTRPQDYWANSDEVLVDEVILKQGGDQGTAADHHYIFAGLLLELGYGCAWVLPYQGRWFPWCFG